MHTHTHAHMQVLHAHTSLVPRVKLWQNIRSRFHVASLQSKTTTVQGTFTHTGNLHIEFRLWCGSSLCNVPDARHVHAACAHATPVTCASPRMRAIGSAVSSIKVQNEHRLSYSSRRQRRIRCRQNEDHCTSCVQSPGGLSHSARPKHEQWDRVFRCGRGPRSGPAPRIWER